MLGYNLEVVEAQHPHPHQGDLHQLAALDPIDPPELVERDTFRDELHELSRRCAFDPASWSRSDFARVQEIFDERAPRWIERLSPTYRLPLLDALERGGLGSTRACLEIGSGTGLQTPSLVPHFSSIVSVDLSYEMLRRSDRGAAELVVCDGALLPFPDASFDALVLVNVFVFAGEYLRVLRAGGVLVLASTRGPLTPIYLAPQDLLACLEAHRGGSFSATTARAAEGEWTVVRSAEVGN